MRYEVRASAYVDGFDEDSLSKELSARFGGSWYAEELPGGYSGPPLGVYREPPPVEAIAAWLKSHGGEGCIDVAEIKQSRISW